MSGPGAPLTQRVRALLDAAVVAYRDTPHADRLRAAGDRFGEPLRVAIAGRVKAGKSTLLNALIGDRLAATDAGECTRVVTWYVHGVTGRVWAHPRGGEPYRLPVRRTGGASVVDLDGRHPDGLDRITVEVPDSRLDRLTLIDTPGTASLSPDVAARTTAFLTADDEPGADAVLYLMRHLHTSDVDFLGAFHDEQFAGTTPVNAIGVLSRADEVGAGHDDALHLAGRVAADYRRDPRVRALMQTVLPVAGLLAQAATALRERDVAALRGIASAPQADRWLLSADRFAADTPDLPAPPEVRRDLLAGLGLFGVRLAVRLLRDGTVHDAGSLAAELRRRSGLDELRAVLLDQFTGRRDLLKAYAALRALESVLSGEPVPQTGELRSRLEAVLVGAHELTELRLLNDLRTGAAELTDPDRRDDAEALLGGAGHAVRARLRLPADTPDEEIRPAVVAALRRWQRIGQSPVAGQGERRTAEVIRRTCEGLLPTIDLTHDR